MKVASPVGRLGEELATDYLRKQGYKIIERNFRKGYGEIDIIATKDNILVFVEVKTRTSNQFGTPFEQISFFKLKALIKTAQFYKLLNPRLPDSLRIDAIGVTLGSDNHVSKIEHLENITD